MAHPLISPSQRKRGLSSTHQKIKPHIGERCNWEMILALVGNSLPFRRIYNLLGEFHQDKSPPTVHIGGLSGSLEAIVVGELFLATHRNILVVVPSIPRSEDMVDDLSVMLGPERVAFLPSSANFLSVSVSSSPEYMNEKSDTLMRLAKKESFILVTVWDTLSDQFPSTELLYHNLFSLQVEREYPREQLLTLLVKAGYSRHLTVEVQGEFAVRGGLVDLFPYGFEFPLRLEFDGDRLIELRQFDPTTQRSLRKITSISFLLDLNTTSSSNTLFSLLDPNTIIFWSDLWEIISRWKEQEGNGVRFTGHFDIDLNEKGDESSGWLNPSEIWKDSGSFSTVIHPGFPIKPINSALTFASKELLPFSAQLSDLKQYLDHYLEAGFKLFLTADTEGEMNRMVELMDDLKVEASIIHPSLSKGFISDALELALIPSHQLWGRIKFKRQYTRFRRLSQMKAWESLEMGDLVVHEDYGIGKFEGLQTIKVRGELQEVMRIRYQDDVILYVSVDNFHKVERYLGTEGTAPQLSRIGGSQWEKTKRRAQEDLEKMAEELLTLYAQRKILPGHAFGDDTLWQKEMEASFEFEETPDQRIATEEIKKDLETPYPMDRLLCGDVGFGKTEVAIRAAFKVVQESYQVAVLVPTTILAQQHYHTFCQRLSPYPVRIEVLSRFKSLSEQKEILKDLREGLVDIIIGTHRLLSKDVHFKRLGLLIIDEEHRFGVRHKERIKQLKTNVDVLTMTATPIPRTLYMAILGVKDTSQLLTPPALRLPVMTEVHPFSTEIIREAIRFELARQGQVFLVHNWVQSIMGMKRLVERLLPGVRVGVAHGQMDEKVLEASMWEFISGKIDVLICTTIIEAGIDIPNANTLIVNRADRLGMAQLYQLKGRIGRSSRQAYAYFLIPPGYSITSQARKRLQALTEFTPLGSGVHLAMKDLEIRGAGNLLGPQQHGHINAVGFHLYTQLLNEAIRKLKDKDSALEDLGIEPIVEISCEVRIPTDYIEEQELRYELYRRIAAITNLRDLEGIEEEINDRFGEMPIAVRNLLEGAKVKLLARDLKSPKVVVKDQVLQVQLTLPPHEEEIRSYIEEIVRAAGEDLVEFRAMDDSIVLFKRLNSQEGIREARLFLQKLTSQLKL